MKRVVLAALVALIPLAAVTSAQPQEIFSAYSSFGADKSCKHTPGREVEDYGSWVCPGHSGLIVRLSAGDQRMQVSFGRTARAAANEEAASQTFPRFQQRLSRQCRMAHREIAERQDPTVRHHPALEHANRKGRGTRGRQINRTDAGGDEARPWRRLPCRLHRRAQRRCKRSSTQACRRKGARLQMRKRRSEAIGRKICSAAYDCQENATLSRTRVPNRSDERATARPPSAR